MNTTDLGTLRFLGDPHEITRGPCPTCGAPVYLVRQPHHRETLALDDIVMCSTVDCGNPAGRKHQCDPSAFVV